MEETYIYILAVFIQPPKSQGKYMNRMIVRPYKKELDAMKDFYDYVANRNNVSKLAGEYEYIATAHMKDGDYHVEAHMYTRMIRDDYMKDVNYFKKILNAAE